MMTDMIRNICNAFFSTFFSSLGVRLDLIIHAPLDCKHTWKNA